MINNTDKVYLDLLKDIKNNGTIKEDRTGTGTISIFGRMVRFNMRGGFPLLTTKKVFTKGVIHELLWFLKGDTNIKYLVDNGVNIWTGDAYKNYEKLVGFSSNPYDRNHSYVGDDKHGRGMGEFKIGAPFTYEEFIEKIKTDERFTSKWGELGPVYGKQWVDCGGINQIQNVIDTLKNNPNSRRIMVNAWTVDEIDEMVLPPCHYGFQLITEELTYDERNQLYYEKIGETVEDTDAKWEISNGKSYTDDMDDSNIPTRKLSLMWSQRSVDTFLGLPFNIASYGLLLHMIAQQVNMVPNELIGSLGDTHLYSNHLEQVDEQLLREPRKLPYLKLNKAEDMFSYTYEDIKFEGYNPHPPIKAELSN